MDIVTDDKLAGRKEPEGFWEVGWTNFRVTHEGMQKDAQKHFFKTEPEARVFEQKALAALTLLGYTSPQAHLYCCEYKFDKTS